MGLAGSRSISFPEPVIFLLGHCWLKKSRLWGQGWIWIKVPKWCRSWCIKGINEPTMGKDSSVPLILRCSLIHLLSLILLQLSQRNALRIISMMFFFFTDTEPCMKFSETLRRIVRSFDRAGQSSITMAYVKTSLHKKRFVRIDFHFCCIIVILILDWSKCKEWCGFVS